MSNKSSKRIGRDNLKSLISENGLDENKLKKLEEKLNELSDEDIEKLFEIGKINQIEYEKIMDFRKKKKKKSQKQIFEERIRCDDTIINKIIRLGRKFRRQETEYKKQAVLDRMIEQSADLEREERLRDRGSRSRAKEKTRERGYGRGREQDR